MKSVFNASARNGGAGKGDLGKSGERAAVVRAVAEIRSDFLVAMRPSDGRTLAFEAELAGGARLSDLGKRRFGSERVPLRFGLRILLDALSGVAALHGSSLRFAHGEMAPWNVVVGHDGFSRLIPLVAAHAEEGAPPSTDATGYVAPERLRGDPFDHRADVFSAGVMLWEMITGRSFRGLPPDVITAWVVDGKVPDPVHPDDAPWVVELARVATRALSVNPGDRWPHVGILGDEIETIAAGHIASRQEVAALFSGASQVKVVGRATDDRKAASRSPAAQGQTRGDASDDTWTPSLSPTSLSIAPTPIIPIAPLPPSLLPTAPPSPPEASPPPSSRAPSSWQPSAPPPSRRAGPASVRPPSSMRRPKRADHRHAAIAWSALGFALVLVSVTTYEVLDGSSSARSVAPARPAETWVVRRSDPAPAAAPPAASTRTTPDAVVAPPADSIAPREAQPASSAVPRHPGVRRAPARRVAPPAIVKPSKPRDDAFGI